jgi:hypothetical protein
MDRPATGRILPTAGTGLPAAGIALPAAGTALSAKNIARGLEGLFYLYDPLNHHPPDPALPLPTVGAPSSSGTAHMVSSSF